MDSTAQFIGHFFAELKNIYGPQLSGDLGVSRREFERLRKGRPFSCTRLDEILSLLNMSLETFNFSSPDPLLAANFLKGRGDSDLPPRYLLAAYSKRRIGRILFAILERYFDPQVTKSLQKGLQIGPKAFSPDNDELKVCTELYAHVYRWLKVRFGLTDQHLYWIGQRTAEYHERGELGKKFQHMTREEAYEYFLEEVAKYVERSYRYQLYHCSKDKVIIRKRFAPHMLEEFKKKSYGNAETDVYSLGFTTTVGYFSTTCFPVARKTACIYEQGNYSEFSINLKQLDSPSRFPLPSELLS